MWLCDVISVNCHFLLCRVNAQQLATENELMMNQMRQTENDTIDVVTFLKKEDQRKDAKVSIKTLIKALRPLN